MVIIGRKAIYLAIFMLSSSAVLLGLQLYYSPDNVAKRYQRITDEYMSQFTSATLLKADTGDNNYRYIHADNCIYKFSPKNNIALKYISFSDAIKCNNGQTISGSIHNIYFISENRILLQLKDKDTYHYIFYNKKDHAAEFSVEYITDSPEDHPYIENDYIRLYKNGTFKEGGEYRHSVTYNFSDSTIKHEIYSKNTNELLGDERYLDYDFRQKEKLRKAEEARKEKLRRAEEARKEELRRAEEAKRIEFNNKIANAISVESVLNDFKGNEPAAQKKYYNKKAIYKGIVKRVEDNSGFFSISKYEISFDSPGLNVIHAYSNDENILDISVDRLIIFEGHVSSFSDVLLGYNLCFRDVTILQYQK